jgi:hypothetical protein
MAEFDDLLTAMGFQVGKQTAILIDGNYLHGAYPNPPLQYMSELLAQELSMVYGQYYISISDPKVTRALTDFLSNTLFKPNIRDQTDTRVGTKQDNSVMIATEIMALTFQTIGELEQLVVISANSDLRFPLQHAKRNRFWRQVGVMRKNEVNASIRASYDAIVDIDVLMPFVISTMRKSQIDWNELQSAQWEGVE